MKILHFLIKKINEINDKQVKVIHDVQQQTRIIQSTVNDVDEVIKGIRRSEEVIKTNIDKLAYKANTTDKYLNELEIRQIMNEQTTELKTLLMQHSFQTQNLIAIINKALLRNMHSSIISPLVFLSELQQVRLQLGKKENFPEQVTLENINKLMKMSNLQVIRVLDNLVFVISIPIVNSREYQLYQPIPVPITQKKLVICSYSTTIQILSHL